MSIELKIKYMTLAAESQLIRSERRKLKSQNQSIADLVAGRVYLAIKLTDKLNRMKKLMHDGTFSESVLPQVRAKYKSRTTQLIRLGLDGSPGKAPSFFFKDIEIQKQANMKSMNSLQLHNVNVVQTEARSTHLARNFLKGVPYKNVESKLRENTPDPDFKAIEVMVKKYGKGDNRSLMQNLSQWIDEANEYIKPAEASG